MSAHFADVVVHVSETLDEEGLRALETEINENVGVMAVGHHPGRPHLLRVDFDAEMVRPAELLMPVRRRGLHGQLVGF